MPDQNLRPVNPWDQGKPAKAKPPIKKWLTFGIALLILLLIAGAIAFGRGFRWGQPFKLNARYLSDGLFAVGLVVTGLGLLVWVSTTGFFDIFSYAFRSMLVMFTPFVKPEEFPKFYEYKTMREAKRKKAESTTLIMGLVMILVSLLMLGIYRA